MKRVLNVVVPIPFLVLFAFALNALPAFALVRERREFVG